MGSLPVVVRGHYLHTTHISSKQPHCENPKLISKATPLWFNISAFSVHVRMVLWLKL